jgi:biotin carboxyl carrier protein
MKKFIVTLGLLVFVAAAMAEGEFVKTLPAADFAAAGLQKLTPEELARLEALVQQYKTGEVTAVRQQTEAKALTFQQEAEKKILAAEAKAREAEVKEHEAAVKAKEAEAKEHEAAAKASAAAAKAPATSAQKQPGWFTALLTLKKAGEKPEKEEPLTSRMMGDFDGWSGRTVFVLENGSRWQPQNKAEIHPYSPVLHSPQVKITPAVFGGFWMEIAGVNEQVRVIPVELPEQK